jgi:hypothetical protein
MTIIEIFKKIISKINLIIDKNQNCMDENRNNNNDDNNCNLVQNYQILENNTPKSLQNLQYGIYPENFNYNNLRLNYNRLQNYNPSAIFYPNCSKDLSYLIKNIVGSNLNFSLRCGGRAYEPASLSTGFVIDVSKFNSICIDKKNMTVEVGSGVRLGNLIYKLAKKRLIMTTGDSSCVGVSGLALAGGKGYLTKLYGMACDNIIECEMINWRGKKIKSCSKSNPDLLWALKGSGHGSYGAITKLKFKIYKDIFCKITTVTWTWDTDVVFRIIKFYQTWIIDKPDNITTDLNMTYGQSGSSFFIKFFKFYKSKKHVDDFHEISNFISCPSNPTVSHLEGFYTQLLDTLVGTNTGNSYPFAKIKSSMVFDLISDDGIWLMINSINNLISINQQFQYQINFTELGGVVNDNNTSSYFPKSARFVITILNSWNNTYLNILGKSIPDNLYNLLIVYTSKYCLANMIDYDLSDYLTSYYGDNQDKLIVIKNKYDPNNIFKWTQSIPLDKSKN